MSDFSMFMKGKKIEVENLKFPVSKGFVDKKGEPVMWEIKQLSAEEDSEIRNASTIKEAVVGKKGQFTKEISQELYLQKMIAACVVFPDLRNAELQDSYGVKTPDQLLKLMLSSGEYAELTRQVSAHNNFDVSFEDEVDEAKN